MPKLKIGIVGCGAIGGSLAGIISRKYSRRAQVSGLFDLDLNKTVLLAKKIGLKKNLAKNDLNSLISGCDLVFEATSAGYSWKLCQEVLPKGRDIMIMSVGGIAGHIRQLLNLADKYNRKVYVPSGAISGVDVLKAAACFGIKKVTLITTKPAKAFESVPFVRKNKINLKAIKTEKVLFDGSAVQAVKNFPQNINVAAVLSLAGLGLKKTRVRIVASSRIKKNIHEIEIISEAAQIKTRTENIAHPDNPKTSFLAVLSAEAVIKQILSPVKIGT
ncbi:MAG: DUF108 domain-containing protein [Candidatus Omnitrophica bacterium]|nr:DUF108 domain-containing protein [Candidatus Omnitrophota bacterium]